jgi:hypothetical protein
VSFEEGQMTSVTVQHMRVAQWELRAIWAAGIVFATLLIWRQGAGNTNLLFNNMFAHLLQGRFDVDPASVRYEAFVRQGRTYSYFGLFCPLLRAPLFLIGRPNVDITALSVLTAAAVSLWARLTALDLAMTVSGGWSRPVRFVVLSATAIAGESLQYLVPDIYQEATSWGAALAAVFVLLTARLLLGQTRNRPAHLAAMAAVAGLELSCRFSFGLGAALALAAILAVELARVRSAPAWGRLLPAIAILAASGAVVAGVNYARWGNPFTFMPLELQAKMHRVFPDRTLRLAQQGALNIARVPFAFQYYFVPLWSWTDSSGRLLFQNTEVRLFDSVELPPSSLFLSDPVAFLLALPGLAVLWRRPPVLAEPAMARLATLALAAPTGLVLAAIACSFRYRMEFYPALDLCACLGAAGLAPGAVRSLELPLRAARIIGLTAAVAGLVLYHLAPLNSATDMDLRRGWLPAVLDVAKGKNIVTDHLMPDGRRIPIVP